MRGFTRQISRRLEACELLHLPRQKFNLDKARQQHAAYAAALETAGVVVTVLPEEPDLPDSCFVEDAVIMLDEVAVICRLGVASRQREAVILEREVAKIRPIRRIVSPGTVEGGDVLQMGRSLFMGISSRTNREGIRQLEEIVSPFGYRVIGVPVKGCLHLKTGVTSPSDGLLIANTEWIDVSGFSGMEIIRVPAEEPWGANTLMVNGTVFVAESAPLTAGLLESRGLKVRRLDISELQKAEAGLTCLSVLHRDNA